MMSNIRSQFKRLVEERTTADTADDTDLDTMSRSELKEAVREGVLEALEDHHKSEHEDVEGSVGDEEVEQTNEAPSMSGKDSEQEISGGLSLKKLFVYGVLAVLLYRRTQKKSSDPA